MSEMTNPPEPIDALASLVKALNSTTWSSWQTTSGFSEHLRIAEETLLLDRVRAVAPTLLNALIHIAEYWNRDQNETAMADALWHIIETAEEAIEEATKATGGAQ